MTRVWLLLLLILAPYASPAPVCARDTREARSAEVSVAQLPKEARATLTLIKKGGPFPYQRDGITFGNFEKRLPVKKRGYYREYTVATPGASNRGARRIIAGTGGEYYYTDDHYQTFRRIRESSQ